MNRDREKYNRQVNKLAVRAIVTITLITGTVGTSLLLANSFLPAVDSLQTNKTAYQTIDRVQLALLEVPPFRQDAPGKISPKPNSVQLNLITATPNQITDEKAWFERNNLSLPIYVVPNPTLNHSGNLPSQIPTNFQDNVLIKPIRDGDRYLLIYGKNYGEGRYLFAYDPNKNNFIYGYDFSNYLLSPSYINEDISFIVQRLTWAMQEDNILYVANAHQTYAKSSHGMNGYLTAIDTNTEQILWRSQPLVCNANNFVMIDDVIICGYGFTAEPDFLYLIDKVTGEILQQINVKTAPEYSIQKDNKLYVRTYDTDYVFEIKQDF
ncbi:hypothetical protein IQ238_16985 [Pleurocapsales cyanobacterium LEGE 06147]|nr:hypothetical protein [Pleurocapsales cyanobacterium LEGE 06147]